MSSEKTLVVDTNIMIRAVLGRRVRQILRKYANDVRFYSPQVCFADAQQFIVDFTERNKGMDRADVLTLLASLESIVQAVSANLYNPYEAMARRRIERRDPDDWPILAVALLLNCGIWTEDQDFFGTGVSTWTTANVETYLRSPSN